MYQPFFWGDYLRDTGQLSLTEHGAYLRLIGEYWSTGKPIPADAERMRRACGVHCEADATAMQYVLERYFHRDGDVWRHSRIERDLVEHANRSEIASEAAKRAANARWAQRDDAKTDARRMPDAMPSACVSDANHSTPNKEDKSSFDNTTKTKASTRANPSTSIGILLTDLSDIPHELYQRAVARGVPHPIISDEWAKFRNLHSGNLGKIQRQSG